MSLDDSIRTAFLEDLENSRIFNIESYGRENSLTIRSLYRLGIINDSSIEEAVSNLAIKDAKLTYDMLRKQEFLSSAVGANCITGQENFAYAISQGVFSEEELTQISFGINETKETFLRSYGVKNLPAILREKLLNPRKPEEPIPNPYCSSCC